MQGKKLWLLLSLICFFVQQSVANGISFKPAASATTPTSLTAKVQAWNQVELTWVDNSTNESNFRIERSLNESSGFTEIGTVAANIKIFKDNTLLENTTYYYRVIALNTTPASDFSEVVSASTPTATFKKNTIAGLSGFSAKIYGNSWADFDRDGDQDVYFSINDDLNQLYLNNGNGTFTQSDLGTITGNNTSTAAIWADFNGDSSLDLFVGNSGTTNNKNQLFLNNGSNSFTETTSGVLVNHEESSFGIVASDINLDGQIDVVSVDVFNGITVFENQGSGTFNSTTNTYPNVYFQSGSFADINQDLYPELFIANVDGSSLKNYFYENQAGTLNLMNSGDVVNNGTRSFGSSWGDFDNDGDLDLFVANRSGYSNLVYRNDNGTLVKIDGTGLTSDVSNRYTYGSGWGDFDNDGYLDLFLGMYNKQNRLFRNNQDGTFSEIFVGEELLEIQGTRSVSWVDYDNDGDLDLVVTHENKPVDVFENVVANSNNWISIELEGSVSNYAAIGAKVRVLADIHANGTPIWQLREITSQSGMSAQADMRAHFGLGTATQVDEVRIEWPSGMVTSYTNLNNNQFLLYQELSGPENLTAGTITSAQVELNWLDPVTNETGFVLERSTGNNSAFSEIATLAANATSYTDNTVSGSTNYFYRIKAVSNISNSGWSNELEVSVPQGTINAPSELTATALSTTEIQITWTDNNSDETGFILERSDLNNQTYIVISSTIAANATSFNDSGLQPNTTYYYRLKTKKDALESGYSNESFTVTLAAPPAIPVDFVVTTFDHAQIELSWTDNTDETEYILERSKDNNTGFAAISTLTANTTSYLDTNLEPTTVYFYRLKAKNSGGESGYSAEVQQETAPKPVTAPANLAVTEITFSQINLAWTDESDNEEKFIIERSVADNSNFTLLAEVTAGTITYSDPGLASNTIYFYRVKAVNTNNESAFSNELQATTPKDLPAAPSGLIVSLVNQSTVNIGWTDNATNETGFRLEKSEDDGQTFNLLSTLTANTIDFQDQGLEPEYTYHYRVIAFNNDGDSDYSNQASIFTTPDTPADPTGLQAVALSDQEIELSWSDNASQETGYRIERSLAESGPFEVIQALGPDVISFNDTNGLTASTTYYYRVTALNYSVESGSSNVANATTTRTPVYLSMPTIIVQPGEQVNVPITVTNFNKISTAQFSLHWDASVLEYKEINLEANDYLLFNLSQTSNGHLTFLMDVSPPVPQTLTDGSTFFNIVFQAIGSDNSASSVEINGNPTSIEFSDENLDPIPYLFDQGLVELKSMAMLSGTVRTAKGEPMNGIEVSISGSVSNEVITAADGAYSFTANPGESVTISAAKTNDAKPNNGISTLDIAIIRRHVLDMLRIENPFHLIAADVNQNKDVSGIDITLIRELVLGIKSSFNDKLWQFVASMDPLFPYEYLKDHQISSATSNDQLNFTAVHLGDVNDSWNAANGRMSTSPGVKFELNEVLAQVGGTINLPITVSDFRNIGGYQFSLEWNPSLVELQEIEDVNIVGNYNLNKVKDGLLTTSWDQPEGSGLNLPDQEVLFELVFKVKGKPGEIASVNINSELTQEQVFDQDLMLVGMEKKEGKIKISEDGVNFFRTGILNQYPNPFEQQVSIEFALAESGTVSFQFYNAAGQLIESLSKEYSAGVHSIDWSPALNGKSIQNGIYFYRFETGSHQEIQRIMKISR